MVEPTEADKAEEFADSLNRAIEESQAYEPCMSLEVCDEGKAVTLYLDTAANTYSEWIPGEGGDIGLMRCQETKRVMGVHLPLYRNNLAVFTKGPIRVNAGFKKDEQSQDAAEADKAAAEAIVPHVVLFPENYEWQKHRNEEALQVRSKRVNDAASIIAQHMAPERQAAAAVKAELEALKTQGRE